MVDGGSLLQRIPWKKGNSFSSIFKAYQNHLKNNYHDNVIVVFDGYLSSCSTKDTTHLRRSKGKTSREVQFQVDMTLQVSKEEFMLNKKNKQRFIDLLAINLKDEGINVVQCEGDADVSVVLAALKESENRPVCVHGEDTDLLVYLLHYAKCNRSLFFTTSKTKTNVF